MSTPADKWPCENKGGTWSQPLSSMSSATERDTGVTASSVQEKTLARVFLQFIGRESRWDLQLWMHLMPKNTASILYASCVQSRKQVTNQKFASVFTVIFKANFGKDGHWHINTCWFSRIRSWRRFLTYHTLISAHYHTSYQMTWFSQ